ncbi:peroxide stress protein YaaA [Nocardioides speluncae]|uniref:peroxide stress protein YaaA n=1 Tax=Nocardioides speluncae TaxID=2670337 RepID=UPI000D693612|nr:peroxide stress protein YaaA [Nocardioides speluncae]
MLILLPPSEGKHVPRRSRPLDPAGLSFPTLTEPRERVLAALVELCTTDAERAAAVLGLGSTQLAEIAGNVGLRTAPAARADRIYTGVLYDALGFATLSTGAKRRANNRIAITSSLFGLVRPGDVIPPYRLAGGVSLPGLGPVAATWRAHLGPAVTDALGNGLLVDLRSSTYAAFWRPPAGTRVATVRVLHEADGKRTVVSHFNKATKGRIVRALLEDGRSPRTPAGLADLLRDLGWKVEVGDPAPAGTLLDVVVDAV